MLKIKVLGIGAYGHGYPLMPVSPDAFADV